MKKRNPSICADEMLALMNDLRPETRAIAEAYAKKLLWDEIRQRWYWRNVKGKMASFAPSMIMPQNQSVQYAP
jgi:hypothetical protein